MRVGREGVLWLTLAWLTALILVSDIMWFVRGGAEGARNERVGVLVAAVAPGPDFVTPGDVLKPDDATEEAPTPEGLATTLGGLLRDPRLGTRVAVSILDAEADPGSPPLLATRADDLVAPASTAKLVTAAAVLSAYGPAARLSTKVVAGPNPGDVILVGGGDPTLSVGSKGAYPGASRLATLAAAVRKASSTPVQRVLVDDSLFRGPTTEPKWDRDIVSQGYGAPVSALTVDGGRTRPTADHISPRASDPALFAGQAFARLLGLPADTVEYTVADVAAKPIATLASPPLVHIVEQMLRESDNVIAEAMSRMVAVERKQAATFEGAAQAVRDELAEDGVNVEGERLVDGSGLSRGNLLTPSLLTGVLSAAADPAKPRLRPLLAGLPVASYSGTLADRFSAAPDADGVVRAKTGTLTGVSALAGYVTTLDGRVLVFAAVANGVKGGGTEAAEATLDQVAAKLASCGCR
jgi:D-alanyl-D-alanine carboxypeptidase/D-alanyl-D-alanine-endopeptidase (penicillin-binding protein 4)